MKKFFIISLHTLLTCAICIYLGIVFLLPQIVNSRTIANELRLLVNKKTGITSSIQGLHLKISPKLNATLNVDSIDAKSKNVKVIDIKKVVLKCELLQKNLTLISADNIYVDGDILKQFKKEKKKKKESNFEFKNIPEIHVQNFTFKSDKINAQAKNIDVSNDTIKLKVSFRFFAIQGK